MRRQRKAVSRARARVRAAKKGDDWAVVYTRSRRRVARSPLYGRDGVGREAAKMAARRHNARR